MAKRITEEEQTVIKEMRKQGYGSKRIADKLGRGTKTIRRQFERLGLPTELEGGYLATEQKFIKVIQCKNCGNDYETKRYNAKFCSQQCRNEYNKNNIAPSRSCNRCGIQFKSYKALRYCSKSCRDKHNVSKRRITIRSNRCIHCGRVRYGHRRKYCSRQCSYQNNYNPIRNNHTIKCKECGKHKEVSYNRKIFCSDTCSNKYEWRRKDMKRRGKIKSNGEANWDISIERLLKRDGSTCYLCNKPTIKGENTNHELYPSIEHVVPISKGGTHTWGNVKIAHRKCNWEKRDRIIESL